MSGNWGEFQAAAAFVGAGLLFLLELALSVALVGVAALNRVALHRLALESEGRLACFEDMHQPSSTHRSATTVLRQLSLIGATLLVAAGSRAAGWSDPLAIGLAAGALFGVLFLEAFVARAVALSRPRAALKATALVVRSANALLYPLVRPLHLMQARIEQSQQGNEERREEEQEEEVEALIEVGEREGILEAEEGEMMRSIVDLDETLVREVMTPRTDIVALAVDVTVDEARRKLLEAGHSRLPIYSGSIDNVVGVLHARDLIRAWEDHGEQQSISLYLRPATFVPETRSAAELLSEMRLKTQVALVVDEYGGIAGLVTLEDLLEEIIGEIRDEHEQEEQELVQPEADGSYTVNAVAHVKELETLFGVEFEDRDFDTVGGLVVSSFGRVPAAGETLEVQGLLIEVLQADRRRILKVRIGTQKSPGGARAGG